MKTFKGFNKTQDERDAEVEQLSHDIAMNFMKTNQDAIGDILLTKLKNGEVDLDDIKDDIKTNQGNESDE